MENLKAPRLRKEGLRTKPDRLFGIDEVNTNHLQAILQHYNMISFVV